MSEKPDGEKQPFTVRITKEARRLLGVLARKEGVSRTAVLEMAIRAYAREKGEPTNGEDAGGTIRRTKA